MVDYRKLTFSRISRLLSRSWGDLCNSGLGYNPFIPPYVLPWFRRSWKNVEQFWNWPLVLKNCWILVTHIGAKNDFKLPSYLLCSYKIMKVIELCRTALDISFYMFGKACAPGCITLQRIYFAVKIVLPTVLKLVWVFFGTSYVLQSPEFLSGNPGRL